MNGYVKDPAHEALDDAGRRRLFGTAAQSILAALLLMAANVRKIQTFIRDLCGQLRLADPAAAPTSHSIVGCLAAQGTEKFDHRPRSTSGRLTPTGSNPRNEGGSSTPRPRIDGARTSHVMGLDCPEIDRCAVDTHDGCPLHQNSTSLPSVLSSWPRLFCRELFCREPLVAGGGFEPPTFGL